MAGISMAMNAPYFWIMDIASLFYLPVDGREKTRTTHQVWRGCLRLPAGWAFTLGPIISMYLAAVGWSL